MSLTQTAQRKIILIEGEFHASLSASQQLCKNLNTLVLQEPKKAHQYLGQEFDAVIFNAHNRFDPNAFGAVSGTIRASGYLLLLKPPQWQQNKLGKSLFLSRFDQILTQFEHQKILAKETLTLQALPSLPAHKTTTTEDQQRAIQAIIKVVKGHRRRPLIISANRGRGKSAALGIAARQLYEQDKQACKRIIVCAPSKKTAAIIFNFAGNNCPLEFYSPNDLQRQKPDANLVLIDEAAAIPVSILSTLVKHYSRIVFSTTQHGYEGSGRGFTLSFKKILNRVAPEWRECHLNTPIRWQDNDQLEDFIFQALLLNAEAAKINNIGSASIKTCQFQKIDKQTLIHNNTLLQETFGLLIDAHYQTKPSDFLQLLDDDAIQIYALSYKTHIIAVCLLVKEGGLDEKLADEVFSGTRRIKGHLVAQSLAANIGIAHAPCLSGQRIMRIAVHPELQGQGLGSQLLNSIIKKVNTDYFSSSFGATEALVNFWKKCHFVPVYLSMKRDTSSGKHSVIMLNAQKKTATLMQEKACQYFAESFPHLLSDPFKTLEHSLILTLIKQQYRIQLSCNEIRILHAFAYQNRGYENSFLPIWKLVINTLNKVQLSNDEERVLINKVLQKKSWEEITKSKNKALKLLRNAVSSLLLAI